jgi:hypothetical protein
LKENHIPLFRKTQTKNLNPTVPSKSSPSTQKKKKPRSDKCHDIKFPVTHEERIRLKTSCKQADYFYKRKYGFNQKLSQTHFNTLLLRYSLRNEHIIKWDKPYRDSKYYMHTKPLEIEYEQIGGPFGYSTRKAMSDRKVVYYLVISALEVMEREGKYEFLFL